MIARVRPTAYYWSVSGSDVPVKTSPPEGITESEHQAILEAVESILTERARVPGHDDATTRRRSGIGLVVGLNVLAVTLLIGAVFVYMELVPRSAPDVDLFSGSVATTEAAILAEVKKQSRIELSEREAQIAQIERELAGLRRERLQSPDATNLARRENELQTALANLEATTSERLAALQGGVEQVGFLADQLAALYGRMRQSIHDQNFTRARALVDDASALLDAPAVRQEPMLAPLSYAIAVSNRVLADVIPLAAEESGRLARMALQLAEIQTIVDQADARRNAGEIESAESLYQTALRVLDATGQASAQLLAIQDARAERLLAEQAAAADARIADLAAQLEHSRLTAGELRGEIIRLTAARNELSLKHAELDGRYVELGQRYAAVETLRREANATAVTLRGRIAELEDEVSARESRIAALRSEHERSSSAAARQIAALRASVDSVRANAATAGRRIGIEATSLQSAIAGSDSREDGPEMIDLLGTRVLLRAVVDSPAVRAQYPNLYGDMESYFGALGRERVAEGRGDAYRVASESVEAVADRLQIAMPGDPPRNTAAGYLSRLIALVEAAVRLPVPE